MKTKIPHSLYKINKIKVANIILDGRFGGPQNRILQVSEKLKKYGVNTVVIIPKKESDTFYSKLIQKDIQVKRLNLHRLTKHKPHLIGWFIFFIPELISLYRYLKRENIDLVHCNAPWQIKGVLAGKMAGLKVIWHINNAELPRGIKKIFYRLVRICDGLILTGYRVKEYYFSNVSLENKYALIQAPVDCHKFNSAIVKEDKRLSKHNGIKIVSLGTINPTKCYEDFIEVARILNKKYENLCFYIVGQELDSQKKYMQGLKDLIDKYEINNVYFYGQAYNVPEVIKAADIYICASESESGPMSVWEAMAMEKAIVSTDVGDVKRFIKDGENGFVVPPRDAKALAEKVSILIENENLRVKFGKLARAVAVKELDVAICADKHRRFYLEVLNNE